MIHRRIHLQGGRRARRGAVYVIVLSISMLVTVIGVAAITAVRVQLRAATNSNDCEEARLQAQCGVELARYWINGYSTWRTTFNSGQSTTMSLGSGSFNVAVSDPADGNFSDSPLDPVLITSTGYKNSARQIIQVTLNPSPTAYTCLNAALACNGLTITSGTFSASGTVASNANIAVNGPSELDAPAEAVGTCSGTNYLQSKTTGVTARTMPDSTAFDYYIQNGTTIPYSSLAGNCLQNTLLSPSYNPYGATNANGIYVINCNGGTINVKQVRIVGTLVILDCRSDSNFNGQVNCAPAISGYPALMVRGSMTFQFDSNSLTEGPGRNYNPVGTPYNGVSNATTSDSYPSIINGLAYVSGNATFSNANTFGGPVVCGGTASCSQSPTINYDATYLNNPPPGFFGNPPMKVVASSWKQAVN